MRDKKSVCWAASKNTMTPSYTVPSVGLRDAGSQLGQRRRGSGSKGPKIFPPFSLSRSLANWDELYLSLQAGKRIIHAPNDAKNK